MNFSEREKLTLAALDSPRVGDRFTEMLSFWVYVIGIDGDTITTTEGSAPVIFPDEGKVRVQTKEEFKTRFLYKTIPGPWVRLDARGKDVKGWLENYEHR